jgi:hypothetical protein
MCLSGQDDPPELGASPSRYPDIHAGGIYDQTKVSPRSLLARQHCLACGVIAQDRNSSPHPGKAMIRGVGWNCISLYRVLPSVCCNH